jgi:hypothetical protein
MMNSTKVPMAHDLTSDLPSGLGTLFNKNGKGISRLAKFARAYSLTAVIIAIFSFWISKLMISYVFP